MGNNILTLLKQDNNSTLGRKLEKNIF